MKKLIRRALTRQHKIYSSENCPKNSEDEKDLNVFREFDKDNLTRFQKFLRKIIPITDEYVMVYGDIEEWFKPNHPLIQFYYDCHIIDFFNIRQHCRRIYWFFQRGFRGWSDRDIWSLDHYLCEWLPDAFYKLKKDKVGTPIRCYPEGPQYIDEKHGGANEIADKIAQETWDSILQKIIDGFSAKRRINRDDCPYEAPDSKMFKSREDYRRAFDIYHEIYRQWEEEQRAIFREGMALFAKHFEDLWD